VADTFTTLDALRAIVSSGERHRYGRGASRVAELRLPDGPGPHPVCVVIHGGYWRSRWSRRTTRPLSAALTRRGWATWNIEYRRVGWGQGGGWPATFDDVGAAIDLLVEASRGRLDLDRVAAVGHSAGGQLAMWAAARPRLQRCAPGADPRVRVGAVAALAPVTRMESGAISEPGGAGYALLGGDPEEVPERYAVANPERMLPLGVPLLVVHGDADETLGLSGSRRFVERAREAGDDATLVALEGADHRIVVDPRARAWLPAAEWLDGLGWLGAVPAAA
jgi:acetyl esterase/lipase